MSQVFCGVTLCPLVYTYSSFYGITEHSSFTAWKAHPMLGHSMTAVVLRTITAVVLMAVTALVLRAVTAVLLMAITAQCSGQ
jgi:hypothetical protein